MSTQSICFASLSAAVLLASFATAQAMDDREQSAPTATYWNSGMSAAQINSQIQAGWRLTNIEIEATSPYRFTVAMVPNSGVYATSWWWVYGVTAATLSQTLSTNNARIIDLEVVDDGAGSPRFTAIMVSNTGSNRKTWGWLYNVSAATINSNVSQHGNRIVDLEQYTLGSTTHYAAVLIHNSGADARSWWFYYNVSQSALESLLTSNNARIYDLDRVGSNYNVVMIRHLSTPIWRYYGLSATQVTDLLSGIGGRLYEINRYRLSGVFTRYDVGIINNSNPLSTRISEILRSNTDGHGGVYLKSVNGPVLAYINGDRPHEPASTLKILHLTHVMRQVSSNQTTLDTQYRTFTRGGPDTCPGGSFDPVDERLDAILRQMMNRSDNNRTRTVTDNFGGFSSLNLRALALGMNSTQVNHHIGCGTPANQTTLRDIAHAMEQVATGYVGSEREALYDLMSNGYVGGGYADGALWPVMQSEFQSAGLTNSEINAFRSHYYMATKKGGYGVNSQFFRAWGGWVRVPTYQNGGVQYQEYLVGAFVSHGTNEANAIRAVNTAAAEVLRDVLRPAIRSWRGYVTGSFLKYGTACAGSSGTPEHNATGTPELSQRVLYQVEYGRTRNRGVVLNFGLSNTSWNGLSLPASLGPLGAGGCWLRVGPVTSVGTSIGVLGRASVSVSIPVDRSLLGQSFFTQYLVLDAPANSLGLVTTEGIRTIVGGR